MGSSALLDSSVLLSLFHASVVTPPPSSDPATITIGFSAFGSKSLESLLRLQQPAYPSRLTPFTFS